LKLEIGNWVEMKRVYELDVYQLAEELSDMVWYDFDKLNAFINRTKARRLNFSKFLISNF
jgi:hypothetical protein